MQSQIKLGQIFDIKIGLHYSWFLIALLIVFSLSGDYHLKHPQWSSGFVLALALVTALLFFLSLLLHELSHSLVAKANGLPVREITLFALGGVSQIEKEAASAKVEFWIAVVGPLTSAFIGLVCLGAVKAVSSGATLSPPMAMLSWLGYINIGLAIFNLIPGYPMDGGRILRAIIWWKTGDLDRSTRAATKAGQAVATVFIAIGIVGYFKGGGLGSLWIAFIGWFLLQAAKDSYVEISLKRSLEGVRVSDVMTRHCPTVDGHLSIQDFVEDELLPTGRRCFIVKDGSSVAGLITPHEIKHVDRAEWPMTRLDAVMCPLEKLRTVTSNTPLLEALQVMSRDDLNQLPVIADGRLEGILSREQVLSYLQTRLELQPLAG
jgi:Zn-dependent protease/predicted transcriptional regulator